MAANDRGKLIGLTVLFGVLVVLGIPVVGVLWSNLNDILAGEFGLRRIGSALASLAVFGGLLAGTGAVLRRLEPDEA